MTTDPLKPHDYWPSYLHMGDCLHCGNVREHPIHGEIRSRLAGAFNRRLVAKQVVRDVWPWLNETETEAIAKIVVEAFEKR